METLESLVEKVSAQIELLQGFEATDIPTLKQAAVEKWKMKVQDVDKLVLNAVEFYSEDRREKDAQRIIPLGVALQIMREMEEAVIEKTVLDPLDIYFKTLASKWAAIKFWQAGIFDLNTWWNALKVLKEIATHAEVSMVRVFLYLFEIGTAAEMGKTIAKVLLQRELFEIRMRKRALPVPTGKIRWPRRKRAR